MKITWRPSDARRSGLFFPIAVCFFLQCHVRKTPLLRREAAIGSDLIQTFFNVLLKTVSPATIGNSLAYVRAMFQTRAMKTYDFTLSGTPLRAMGSGALWWPEEQLLVVSDLHLGKSERIARRGGASLPPYDTRDTLTRLAADLALTHARDVVCLGDSFDDIDAAHALPQQERDWITRLQAGRRWVWIEGNHDPGPIELGGTHLAELPRAPLVFRHIARAGSSGEISGHYHPKASLSARGSTVTRPAFLVDSDRVILPAYGTYTGGLRVQTPALRDLMRHDAVAVLTGPQPLPVPLPR